MTKIKTFINKYNWKGINYTSERDDSEKIEKNNLMVALNVLHAKKYIYIYILPMLQNITQIIKNKLLLY